MEELALHILDILQNSIAAGARFITLVVTEDTETDMIIIEIIDDGKGMTAEFARSIQNPFVTSRTTRKVGLGIPLFKAAAEQSEGRFSIASQPGMGTTVTATFRRSHIDTPPMGDLAGTVVTTAVTHPEIEFLFSYRFGGNTFEFDTREIKRHLDGVPMNAPDIFMWLNDYVKEGMDETIHPALE